MIYERSVFHSRKQEGETIEEFSSDLYDLVHQCEYQDTIWDDTVRDRFVLGLNEKDLQLKMYEETDLDLERAIAKATC